ncbi:MAG TPA: Nramp family divalent metal transporter, partial [Acidimicrobiia bacterium]|nr:Nramp family divalent metal transporter [Acidimicrobiia bacterium]
LALSNWVREKRMGMGARLMSIESPFTGHPGPAAPVGAPFQQDDENMRRWHRWWRLANQEHLMLFVVLVFTVTAGLSALSSATVFGMDVAGGFDFIRAEGRVLAERAGPWLRDLLWVTGVVILFSTNLGIIDHMGRLIADILKANWLAHRQYWSESRLYVVVVWGEILVASGILLSGLRAPLVLIVISGVAGGLVMFVYSILLIRLNRTRLPPPIRLRGPRLWAMAWAVILFGSFSFYVVWTGFVPTVTGS